VFNTSTLLRGIVPFGAISFALAGLILSAPVPSNAQQGPAAHTQKAGKYSVELRLPAEGLFAEQETDVEFHVSDSSMDDPVQGPPPIVKAVIAARVTMPQMASMPAQSPKTHSEGVPGDYGVVLYFPHGGEYRLDLKITPPGGAPFTVTYKLPVSDARAARGRTVAPKPFTLEVVSDPKVPEAGRPAALTILIRSRDTKQPVTEFDTVHTKQIHFMVVSADLQDFSHEHPDAGADGRFTLTYTFPTAGEYHLFADVAPKGAGSQILMQPIRVAGASESHAPPTKLSQKLSDTSDGLKVALATEPSTLPVGRTLNITFTVKDAATGAPITDLEPYLGAMAHLMLIHQDGITFVHSHPDETDPANGHNGSLTFLARFPKPGLYRAWLQTQRAGKVVTTEFTWEVPAQTRP
jgi:hypothetical protein